MFETTSEARCLHSCSALEAAFSVRYSFQASVANAIETMQLQERGVQNCIRTEYMVFVTGFKKSKENSRTPNDLMLLFGPICWFAHGISLMYAYTHESQRKGTSVFLRPGPTSASLGPQISDAPCSAAVPWRRRSCRSWGSWTLLTSKRTEPKRIWVNFR